MSARLIVEGSSEGLDEITIRVGRRGSRDEGMALLAKAMPALTELNRRLAVEDAERFARGRAGQRETANACASTRDAEEGL
jgi:hypothetical protein